MVAVDGAERTVEIRKGTDGAVVAAVSVPCNCPGDEGEVLRGELETRWGWP